MKAFFAIAALTVRHAVRSHIFQLLLGVLLLCVLLIPGTAGDSTAAGFIQVSLLYSLSTVLLILALSSIWLGCFVMCHDVDSYQLHMVITKPVSRVTIWLGKFSGILAINTVLLLISTMTVFAIVMWKFNATEFDPEDRTRAENEVLVGRRVFLPEAADIDHITRLSINEKHARMRAAGRELPDDSPQAKEKEYQEVRRQAEALQGEISFGHSKIWRFTGLPADLQAPLYLRYRSYVGRIHHEGQRMTLGTWAVRVPIRKEEKGTEFQAGKTLGFQTFWTTLTPQPESIRTGVFNEKTLRGEWRLVAPDGTLEVGFQNADPRGQKLFFQPADGPKLLLKVASFGENYARCVLVMFLELVILTGLACAAAAFLTMPTAIFVVISYLLFGSFASYMAETSFFGGAADYVGYYVGKLVLIVVIPIQKFAVTEMVSQGELIEMSFIGGLILSYLVVRALPLFLFGIWMYRKRELGLVVRK